MKFGPVLTYKDIDEAKGLIGKRVEYSDNLMVLERSTLESGDTLLDVIENSMEPFLIDTARYHADRKDRTYQFIRGVIEDEPEGLSYEPYDLSNPAVRKSLRGRWIIWNDEDGADEAVIIGFTKQDGDPWHVRTSIGSIDAAELLKFYVFDDGTPCGRRVE